MTDEDIRKLSKECALYYQGRPSNKGYELSNRLTIESYALMTLRWLTDKFCIVEKDKARELARLTLENGCSEDFGLIDGLVDWLCYNFEDEYREEVEK